MKILVNVAVPAINENYDMFIPDCIGIRELIALIAQAVEEASSKKYVSSGNELLCHKRKNMLLSGEVTPDAYDIENGDSLILI